MAAAQVALQVRQVTAVEGLAQVRPGKPVDLQADEARLPAGRQPLPALLAEREELDAVEEGIEAVGERLGRHGISTGAHSSRRFPEEGKKRILEAGAGG
jgi:hypothetical protein